MLTLPLKRKTADVHVPRSSLTLAALASPFWAGWPGEIRFGNGRFRAGGRELTPAGLHAYQTRPTVRYAAGQTGSWRAFAAGTNAILPSTGYLSGEAWSNAITNPLMSGAVDGLRGGGGALPDGWLQGVVAGIDVTVTPITRDGLPALRVRMAGTNTAGSAQYPHLYFVTGVTAAPGQAWTLASLIDITDASDLSGLANGEFRVLIQERQSGAYLANHQSSGISLPGVHEPLLTATLANANCNQIRAGISLPIAAGGSVDFTLEIVAPRLVQAAFDQGFGVGATAADALVIPASDLGMNVTPSVTGVTAIWRGRVFESAAAFPQVFSVWADGSNRLSVAKKPGLDQAAVSFGSGGLYPGQTVVSPTGQDHTIGATWRPDGSYAIASSEEALKTGIETPMVGALTALGIGCNGVGNNPVNGQHKLFACKPAAVSDAELQSLMARAAT